MAALNFANVVSSAVSARKPLRIPVIRITDVDDSQLTLGRSANAMDAGGVDTDEESDRELKKIEETAKQMFTQKKELEESENDTSRGENHIVQTHSQPLSEVKSENKHYNKSDEVEVAVEKCNSSVSYESFGESDIQSCNETDSNNQQVELDRDITNPWSPNWIGNKQPIKSTKDDTSGIVIQQDQQEETTEKNEEQGLINEDAAESVENVHSGIQNVRQKEISPNLKGVNVKRRAPQPILNTTPTERPRSRTPINIVTLGQYAHSDSPPKTAPVNEKISINLPSKEFVAKIKSGSKSPSNAAVDKVWFTFDETSLFSHSKSGMVVQAPVAQKSKSEPTKSVLLPKSKIPPKIAPRQPKTNAAIANVVLQAGNISANKPSPAVPNNNFSVPLTSPTNLAKKSNWEDFNDEIPGRKILTSTPSFEAQLAQMTAEARTCEDPFQPCQNANSAPTIDTQKSTNAVDVKVQSLFTDLPEPGSLQNTHQVGTMPKKLKGKKKVKEDKDDLSDIIHSVPQRKKGEFVPYEERLDEKSEEWQAFQAMQDRIKQTVVQTKQKLTKLESSTETEPEAVSNPNPGASWVNFEAENGKKETVEQSEQKEIVEQSEPKAAEEPKVSEITNPTSENLVVVDSVLDQSPSLIEVETTPCINLVDVNDTQDPFKMNGLMDEPSNRGADLLALGGESSTDDVELDLTLATPKTKVENADELLNFGVESEPVQTVTPPAPKSNADLLAFGDESNEPAVSPVGNAIVDDFLGILGGAVPVPKPKKPEEMIMELISKKKPQRPPPPKMKTESNKPKDPFDFGIDMAAAPNPSNSDVNNAVLLGGIVDTTVGNMGELSHDSLYPLRQECKGSPSKANDMGLDSLSGQTSNVQTVDSTDFDALFDSKAANPPGNMDLVGLDSAPSDAWGTEAPGDQITPTNPFQDDVFQAESQAESSTDPFGLGTNASGSPSLARVSSADNPFRTRSQGGSTDLDAQQDADPLADFLQTTSETKPVASDGFDPFATIEPDVDQQHTQTHAAGAGFDPFATILDEDESSRHAAPQTQGFDPLKQDQNIDDAFDGMDVSDVKPADYAADPFAETDNTDTATSGLDLFSAAASTSAASGENFAVFGAEGAVGGTATTDQADELDKFLSGQATATSTLPKQDSYDPFDVSHAKKMAQGGSGDDEDSPLKVVIRSEATQGDSSPAPALPPPPKASKDSTPPRFNPFNKDQSDSDEEDDNNKFVRTEEVPRSDSGVKVPLSPPSEDSYGTPDDEADTSLLEDYNPSSEGRVWKLMLRQPGKKQKIMGKFPRKIKSNRYWKEVCVRLEPGENHVLVKLYADDKEKRAFQEVPLQPCYAINDISLQQYDEFGKIFTTKLQYIFFKERVGVKPEKILTELSYPNFLERFRPKPTMALEHQPTTSELLKFGSLNYVELRSFIWAVEDALMKTEVRRDKSLTYTKDEVQCLIQDEYQAMVDKDGHIFTSKARARIYILAFVTGMPSVELGVNDRRRKGKEIVGRHDIIPIKTEEWIRIQQYEFHCTINKDEFEKTGNIICNPLDGIQYELLRFRVKPKSNMQLPLQVFTKMLVTKSLMEIRAEVMVPGFHSNSKRAGQVPCEDIQIRFPIPEEWIYYFRVERRFGYGSVHSTTRKPGKIKGLERLTALAQGLLPTSLMEASVGMAKYEHLFHAIVWRIDKLPSRNDGAYKTHLFSCKLNFAPHDQFPDTYQQYVDVEFTMPNTTISGTQVRSISVSNPEPPEKWVRYLGKYQYKTEIDLNIETENSEQDAAHADSNSED